jgi:hypothetical protein
MTYPADPTASGQVRIPAGNEQSARAGQAHRSQDIEMRIVDIRERAIPIRSNISNSSFDFSEMTTSVVAVLTDVVRAGRPVVGFVFDSTRRYCGKAQGPQRID